jgi:CheY-like chemotaxis protein
MPIMDGFEATRKLRNIEKERNLKPIPIIALTANGMEDIQQTCLSCGMNDYLLKPFSPVELRDCIIRNLRVHEHL